MLAVLRRRTELRGHEQGPASLLGLLQQPKAAPLAGDANARRIGYPFGHGRLTDKCPERSQHLRTAPLQYARSIRAAVPEQLGAVNATGTRPPLQRRGGQPSAPALRGRILFPQHIHHSAANRARFYVGFDEFTADRPVNRLIHSAILKLRSTTQPANQQLLHQLRICFSEVPQSARPEVDWQRHRIDRSMRHYDTVMAWVGLFLFNHGLATFAGRHVNQALLFPMEEVFEDFVVDAFQRYQRDYRVRTQGPQESFTKIGNQQAFHMKPDIALIRAGEVHFILDAKWKKGADNSGNDPKHGVTQNDIYQLYAYGRKFGCATVALMYPQTQKFRAPLRYEFNDSVDGQLLTLLCLPFNIEQPAYSVREILVQLTSR